MRCRWWGTAGRRRQRGGNLDALEVVTSWHSAAGFVETTYPAKTTPYTAAEASCKRLEKAGEIWIDLERS